MNRSRWLALAVGVAFLLLIGSTQWHRASAQDDGPAFGPRYQVSAWATPASESHPFAMSGCYMVDTVTGVLWELQDDGGKRSWARVAEAPAR